jgi:hypothetical protein
MCILQGVTMLQVEAIPICGLEKSLRLKPTACNMARLAARSTPSTIFEEYNRFVLQHRFIKSSLMKPTEN